MINYPFNKCLHPKRIRNPYTHQMVTVNCDKCDACLIHKASTGALKCRLESLSHKYCMFVTLTYDEPSVPRMVRFLTDEGTYLFKDNTHRLAKYDDIYHSVLGEINSNLKDIQLLTEKFKTNYFPYLCKKDLQLFIKRLRKQLTKYSDEKIRYYAVGEYGPKHFRPHLHLLVWFSSPEIFENFTETLHSCWQFGRIDSELSKGDCASYVASYLNCYNNLPQVLKFPSTKPFCCHSSRLGETVLRQVRKEAYSMPFDRFIQSRHRFDAKLQDVFCWRSLETWFFPQCRNYARESIGSMRYAYNIYRTAQKFTGEISPYRQAKYIVYLMFERLHDYHWHYDKEFCSLIEYFESRQRFSTKKLARCNTDLWDQMFRSIYHDLYISYHFLTNCCNKNEDQLLPTYEESYRMIDVINKHYSDKNYSMLLKQFNNTNELLHSEMYNVEDVVFSSTSLNRHKTSVIPYLYDNAAYSDDIFNKTHFPKVLAYETSKSTHKLVKHKLANDANQIYNNI